MDILNGKKSLPFAPVMCVCIVSTVAFFVVTFCCCGLVARGNFLLVLILRRNAVEINCCFLGVDVL